MAAKSRVVVDHIFNGQGYGGVAEALVDQDLHPGMFRPWRSKKNGKSYVSVNGRNLAYNARATLTKEQWKAMDSRLITVARPLLRVWGDIVGEGLTHNVPDGMGTIFLQQQTMTDGGTAIISMDPAVEAERDRPTFDTRSFPLPVIHGDVSFSMRQLVVSRRPGLGGIAVPLDTTMLEQVTRRITEKVELMTIGASNQTFNYGGATPIQGLTTKTERLTSTLTLPTDPSWTPELFNEEILDMIQDLQDLQFNGPYGVYYSPSWGKYLNGPFSSAYNGGSLLNYLRGIDEVKWFKKIHYGLSGYQVIVFQLSSDVIRAVTGLRLQTIQWYTKGGLGWHAKVICMMVPQLQTNADNETGINHGTAA